MTLPKQTTVNPPHEIKARLQLERPGFTLDVDLQAFHMEAL